MSDSPTALTLAREASAEIVERGSRFIGEGKSVSTSADAMKYVREVQARYPDATHHCFAYVVSGPPAETRFSDAGEPSGSAGRPILTVVEHKLVNSVIVVTRYFGGTKLGVGGLVRAYSRAANALIDAAGTVTWERMVRVSFRYPYELSRPIQYRFDQLGLSPSLDFGGDIRAKLELSEGQLKALRPELDDWTRQGLQWEQPAPR